MTESIMTLRQRFTKIKEQVEADQPPVKLSSYIEGVDPEPELHPGDKVLVINIAEEDKSGWHTVNEDGELC